MNLHLKHSHHAQLNDPGFLRAGKKVILVIRGEEFASRIHGWKQYQFLIVDTPKLSPGMKENRLLLHTECEVRVIHDGWFISFKSVIFCVNHYTADFLAIEYPHQIKTHTLRAFERYKVVFPVMCMTGLRGNAVEEKPGTIRDISYGGALVTLAEPLAKGSRISLRGKLGSLTLEPVDCIIRNIRQNPKGKKEPYAHGVEFITVSDRNRKVFEKTIEACEGCVAAG